LYRKVRTDFRRGSQEPWDGDRLGRRPGDLRSL